MGKRQPVILAQRESHMTLRPSAQVGEDRLVTRAVGRLDEGAGIAIEVEHGMLKL